MTIPILYEDTDILAVNKPAGIMVHGDGKSADPTLADWVAEHYPQTAGVGEAITLASGEVIERPGIVHRLDKDTSGVLLVAKTQAGFDALKRQFQEGGIKKTYQAIVYGSFKERAGIIDTPIGRSKNDFRLRSAGGSARGLVREARTEYVVVAEADRTADKQGRYALVEVRPKTGRTHQIRVHMRSIGHPVVCDALYARSYACPKDVGRLALHAFAIEFVPVGGEQVRVEAPLPEDLRTAIATLFGLR